MLKKLLFPICITVFYSTVLPFKFFILSFSVKLKAIAAFTRRFLHLMCSVADIPGFIMEENSVVAIKLTSKYFCWRIVEAIQVLRGPCSEVTKHCR